MPYLLFLQKTASGSSAGFKVWPSSVSGSWKWTARYETTHHVQHCLFCMVVSNFLSQLKKKEKKKAWDWAISTLCCAPVITTCVRLWGSGSQTVIPNLGTDWVIVMFLRETILIKHCTSLLKYSAITFCHFFHIRFYRCQHSPLYSLVSLFYFQFLLIYHNVTLVYHFIRMT